MQPCQAAARRLIKIERDKHFVFAEVGYAARLMLADHREAEHLLVEMDGPQQVHKMNADVVDVPVFEIASWAAAAVPLNPTSLDEPVRDG
jgi:hypothetical protein